MTWLQSLTACPAPLSPTWTIVLPIASSTGRARAKASAGPPTMIESLASRAPVGPPLTGASSMAMPRSASAAAMVRVAAGEIVLISTSSFPAGGWSSRPPGWRTTSSTCGVSGSMVIARSAPATASAMPSAGRGPRASIPSSASGRRSSARTSWPALARLIAM